MQEKNHPVALFIGRSVNLDNELTDAICSRFTFREFKKNDFFLNEGKVSDEYMYLERGYMRSFVNDLEGNEVTVNFYAPGTVVFEVASFFQRIPAQENIQSLTESGAWVISFQELNTLFHTYPQFREFGRSMLVQGFVALKVRSLAMINRSAEERYLQLIKNNPEIFQYASLKHIASYLGVTDTSLSRIRKSVAGK